MTVSTLDMLEGEARVKGRWEGRAEGHAVGIADGEARYAKLVEASLAEFGL